MPYKKKKSGGYRKRYLRKQKGRARPYTKNIQSASWVPARRKVMMSDTRSFYVKDSSGLTSSIPISRSFSCNDPVNAFMTTYVDGSWLDNSLGAKGAAVPAIAKWVCAANGSGTGDYRTASAISSEITVTVTPMPRDGGHDAYQDMAQVILHRSTGPGHIFHGLPVSATYNAEVTKQLPCTTSAMVWYSGGAGNPKGCTLKGKYRFSSVNGLKTSAQNIFTSDGLSGNERDSWCLTILPGDSHGYGIGGTRMTDMRIEVKIDYVVALSEPSTNFTQLNEGISLSGVAGFVGGLADFAGAVRAVPGATDL